MIMMDVEMDGLVFFLDFLMYCCHTTTECFAEYICIYKSFATLFVVHNCWKCNSNACICESSCRYASL